MPSYIIKAVQIFKDTLFFFVEFKCEIKNYTRKLAKYLDKVSTGRDFLCKKLLHRTFEQVYQPEIVSIHRSL